MDQLHWGVIGSLEEAKAFAADLPYASENHILQALLTDEKLDDEVPQSVVPHIYTDLQEFLLTDIDAVYVASPQEMHYAYVKQCLLHHKPVLCEKPIAKDAEELRHLNELSQSTGTFMMEAMWIRFLPNIKKVLGMVSSGVIGDIISIKSSANRKSMASNSLLSERNILIELGTHPVFLCVLFLGRPDYVQGTYGQSSHGPGEFLSAYLSYEEGQYAFIEASTINRSPAYALIEGDKGFIQIKNPWSTRPEGIEVDLLDGTKVLHKSDWQGTGFQFEVDEVYKCLKEGLIESQLYPHHFSLDIMYAMDDIRQQIK